MPGASTNGAGVAVEVGKPATGGMQVQVPVPTIGGFPESETGDELHRVWSDPALAEVGGALMVMTVSSKLSAQGALLIVQRKVYIPGDRVKGGGNDAVVGNPATGGMQVQIPVPTVGRFPDSKTGDELHKVWSDPAFAAVGGALTVMTASSKLSAQGALLMVQRKV